MKVTCDNCGNGFDFETSQNKLIRPMLRTRDGFPFDDYYSEGGQEVTWTMTVTGPQVIDVPIVPPFRELRNFTLPGTAVKSHVVLSNFVFTSIANAGGAGDGFGRIWYIDPANIKHFVTFLQQSSAYSSSEQFVANGTPSNVPPVRLVSSGAIVDPAVTNLGMLRLDLTRFTLGTNTSVSINAYFNVAIAYEEA